MPLHGKIVVIKRSGGDGTEFPLTATCLFGRRPDCDIRIQLPQVSKEHCRIDFNENKEIVLTNLSSVNPTRVNGEALQQSERLKHGDVITIIDRSFRFEYPPAPTPKKRSSTAGKTETLKVLQNQSVGDTVATESVEKSIPEESTDPHLKDGTNHDNIQRSLEKTVALEAKEDDGLLQSKTVSPFNDLYQMIKKSLDVKTPRKSSASGLETPTSRFCTPKPGLVKKSDGKPVISTEDKSTPQKAENTEEAGIVGNETPKSVKKQRRSFQVPSTEMVTPAGEEAENAAKSESTSLQRRSRTPPKRFSAGEAPKSPVRRRSKEAKPAVTKEQEEQVVTSPKREGLRKASPRNSGKVEKVKETSKKRKSGELVADKPQAKKKRVSFGGVLCPELFDKRLPPDSPLRKGATPRRSLCVPKPSQSLLRRASAIGVPKSKSTARTPSPKRSSSSPKASPKTSQKSRSPSPAKKSPKSKTPSPKAASPATKSKSPPASDLDSSCSIKRVQGRFSVSHISTPSPIAEDTITDLVPLVTQTPKIPLRRRSACRETPSMANSAAKVVRRSGVSRASMKVKISWANIVRFGQTKPQVAAPAKKTVNKKTTKKTEPKPKTPARKLKDHVSTGHADSPVTIVVGRAHKQKVVHPTGAAPKIVTNIALLKKNMKMDEDLTGISEMLKTPAHEQKRISAFNVYNASKTPVGGLGTSVVEPSVLDTPEETGEMIVSPLSVTVKDKSYNSEAVQRLFNNNDEEASIVSDTSAMDESDRQQCVDLKTTSVATPKQKPEQQECLTGVKRIMRTPKQKAEPIEDLRGKILKTPKQKPEQQECLTGVKRMMKTPSQEAEPLEDLGKPLEMLKAQEEGAVGLDAEELTEQTGQVETNEVADKKPQDCDEDVAKELDFACEEPQDDVPTDVTADVSQVDMEKNSKEVVADDHLEEVPSGHDNESSDAMETVSQSAVDETVSVEQPEVDTADEPLSEEEQPKEEMADEPLSEEEQPKEETADEHLPEQPKEETADEPLSEQPKEDTPDEPLSEEQPKDETADEHLSKIEQPEEEKADEHLSEEEQPKEETADEHLSEEEQPKEETADEPLCEEQQPKVETATVTEVDETATDPDHEKTIAEELKSAEAKQEAAEHSEEPVVSAPVRGRRGKKTEATAPPAVRQTTRGRNAKSQVCVSDQPEVEPEKAVETLETEIPTEAVSHQMSPIKESDSVPPAEEAPVKSVRGRKTKATPVEPQPEKKEVVSDESLTADAQPQKSMPAPGKPRRGRKPKPDAVEQNEVSEDTIVAVETKPPSPVRAKRGRNAKRGDEKLESSSVETTESQEPAKKLRRGQKTQQEQASEDQAEIIQEVPTETEVVPEPESEQSPSVDVPNDASDSAAHLETAVLKPKRGRKAKQPEKSVPEQQDTHSTHSGDQADMAQENANEVCSDPEEVVASGSDDISPDAMETVPQAPVTESLPEVETTGKVTETLPAVALKKPGRGRKVKLVESTSAEDKEEATEPSEEPVVSAPVRGRRGKKTEAAAPPAARQTTRGRNAKSQVCVSDQPEVEPEKAVETLETEISEIKESDSAPAEEAAVKLVRGRKLKTTAEQPQSEPEKNEVVSDEPLTADAQPQKSIPAPAKSRRGRKTKPDAVEQNEASEETKQQSPVRAKRGRNAKQEEEKLESSSVETTESQEPAKKLRGKKAEKGSAKPRDVQAVEEIVATEAEAPLIAEPVKTDEQATVTAKPRRGRKAKQAPESETLVESIEGQEVLAVGSTDKPKRVRRGKVTEEAEVAAVAPEEQPDHELEAEEKSNAEPDAPVIKQGRTRGVKTSVKKDILQAIPAKRARRGVVVPLEETNAESTVLVSEPASTSVEPAKRGRRAAAKPTADEVMVTSDQAKSSDDLISAVVEDTKTSKRSVRWKEDSEETPVKAVRGRKSKLAGQVETGSKTVSADADQTEETDLSDTVVEAQPIKRARRGAKVADVDPASSVDKSEVKTVEADPQPKTRRGRSAKK